METYREPINCPKCGNIYVDRSRARYCGAGDTNYITCTCRRCGEKWEEID